jgi:hypothetical protein
MLRIDVYEVGNGDQLVKSSSQIDPIERNDATGFDEIYLDCNYTGYIFSGGGIVQPTTGPVDTKAISTDSVTNSIVVEDITEFTLDDDIYFTGDLFGGVTAGTTYYVKSINTVLSSIVISTTPGGAVFNLTDGSGDNMVVVIQKGPGQFWTKPAVFHNGELLTPGYTNSVIRTYAGTNKLVTYSTLSMNVGDKIKFDDSAFGGLVPQTFYTVESIISDTEFTLTGVVLSNAYGITTFVTNDYAAAVTGNNITAKVIFSSNMVTRYLQYKHLLALATRLMHLQIILIYKIVSMQL